MLDGPRYEFHPLERRGLLLGLDAGQLIGVLAAAVGGLVVHSCARGPAAALGAFTVAVGGAVSAVWTRDGRPLAAHALIATAWLVRRRRSPRMDDLPTSGVVGRLDGPVRAGPVWSGARQGRRRSPATAPAPVPGIDLIEAPGVPGEGPLGVVRDRRSGTWAAAVPVRGCSFALLDPSEQAQKLEGWRRVLGAMARPGSPVVRLQWLQRSWSGAGEMVERGAWLVVVVRAPQDHRRPAGPGGQDGRGIAALRRELRLLEGQLRAADVDPLGSLDLAGLSALVAGCPRRPGADGQPDGTGPPPWPMARDDGWSAYRADGSWHVTYWISEWPRLQVGPDFLTPLLVGPVRGGVSVIMAPVAPDRAMRQVRSARTADAADAELRARAGFLQSARRERESEGVVRREAELADGHQEFRFSGYVTVTADDRDQLHAACAAAEHAAQSAHVQIRRLYGRQEEAYTWTLPLGRGLR